MVPEAGSSTLVVIDLWASAVARRVGLRSTVTDIAVDASSGLVVGAQAGGLGSDADRVASLTDARSGEVRYVELPVADPGDVACIAGLAYMLHSTVDASGTVFSVVDVARAAVVGAGHVPGYPGPWASAAGAVWTTGEDAIGGPSLRRIDPRSLSVTPFSLGGLVPMGLAGTEGGPIVLGAEGAAESKGVVALIDPRNGSAIATAAPSGLVRAPRLATKMGGRLVIGDWSGDEPEGRALRVLDGATLSDLGSLQVDGVPCALAAWEDRLLVVDRVGGRLLVMDPTSGRTLSTIDLGCGDLIFSDVVVIDARSGG
jgi:hypothetical protein